MVKFRPETLVYRVILKPFVEKETKSGIIISTDARTQAINTDRGEIVMFGNQAWKDYGCVESPFKVGDKVYYAKYGAKTIKPEGSEDFLILCNDEDILVGYENE